MNILPKKRWVCSAGQINLYYNFYSFSSWHVLSRDNVLRVRRDEAEAKAKEEEQQKRADLAVCPSVLGMS